MRICDMRFDELMTHGHKIENQIPFLDKTEDVTTCDIQLFNSTMRFLGTQHRTTNAERDDQATLYLMNLSDDPCKTSRDRGKL